jgi:hypothetical protein
MYSQSPSVGGILGLEAINSLTYVPFFIPKRISLDRLGIRCSTTRAGSQSRIGIYSNSSNGLPTNLLLDAGDIDTSTLGFKETIVSLSLNIGWYWLAANCNILTPSVQVSNSFFGSLYFLGSDAPTATSSDFCYSQSLVMYGALPSIAPVSNLVVKSIIPLFWFRIL